MFDWFPEDTGSNPVTFIFIYIFFNIKNKINLTYSKISTNSDGVLRNVLGKSSTKTSLQLLLSSKDM